MSESNRTLQREKRFRTKEAAGILRMWQIQKELPQVSYTEEQAQLVCRNASEW